MEKTFINLSPPKKTQISQISRMISSGIAAKRHASRPCVTASVDATHFLHPISIHGKDSLGEGERGKKKKKPLS